MKVHHIGYLVQNIKEAVEAYSDFGGVLLGEIIYDKDREIDIAFVKNGEVLIEFVSPRSGSQEIGKSLMKLGNSPYHICYECDDLDTSINSFREKGCIIVKNPQRAVAIGGKRVAFLYSENLGLFELVEMHY